MTDSGDGRLPISNEPQIEAGTVKQLRIAVSMQISDLLPVALLLSYDEHHRSVMTS